MKTNGTVRVNGETFDIEWKGLSLGDAVKGVGEQCEGCGNALDAEEPATLQARGQLVVECPCCHATYAIRVSS